MDKRMKTTVAAVKKQPKPKPIAKRETQVKTNQNKKNYELE